MTCHWGCWFSYTWLNLLLNSAGVIFNCYCILQLQNFPLSLLYSVCFFIDILILFIRYFSELFIMVIFNFLLLLLLMYFHFLRFGFCIFFLCAMFPCFFMWLVTLGWNPHICKNSHFSQGLQISLYRKRPLPMSTSRDSGVLSYIFLWICLLWICACRLITKIC